MSDYELQKFMAALGLELRATFEPLVKSMQDISASLDTLVVLQRRAERGRGHEH